LREAVGWDRAGCRRCGRCKSTSPEPVSTLTCWRNMQVMSNTEAIIKHALSEGLPLVLVVNKMDRLILELRLPPSEAFFKIKHTIEEVNSVIA
jgi:hypothetical protein